MTDHSPCALRPEGDSGVNGDGTEIGPGGVPKGAKTSDYYRVHNIPSRFDNPGWFQGYGSDGKQQNPMYITSASTVGKMAPTVHTSATSYHGRSQKFTKDLGKCGNYRNHSLNTALDKSNI